MCFCICMILFFFSCFFKTKSCYYISMKKYHIMHVIYAVSGYCLSAAEVSVAVIKLLANMGMTVMRFQFAMKRTVFGRKHSRQHKYYSPSPKYWACAFSDVILMAEVVFRMVVESNWMITKNVIYSKISLEHNTVVFMFFTCEQGWNIGFNYFWFLLNWNDKLKLSF